MKDIIKEIKPVPDTVIEQHLIWLLKGKNHSLNEYSTADMIRYLIKKVDELEDKVERLESRVKMMGGGEG